MYSSYTYVITCQHKLFEKKNKQHINEEIIGTVYSKKNNHMPKSFYNNHNNNNKTNISSMKSCLVLITN